MCYLEWSTVLLTNIVQNIDLADMEKKVEATRLLAICLDDSDDESSDIIWAESTRKEYVCCANIKPESDHRGLSRQQPYIRYFLRERSFLGRLSWKLKRSWKSNPVQMRRAVTNEMEACLNVYKVSVTACA